MCFLSLRILYPFLYIYSTNIRVQRQTLKHFELDHLVDIVVALDGVNVVIFKIFLNNFSLFKPIFLKVKGRTILCKKNQGHHIHLEGCLHIEAVFGISRLIATSLETLWRTVLNIMLVCTTSRHPNTQLSLRSIRVIQIIALG